MFLQRFKKNSIRNYINKILNSRNMPVSDNKIESVGVILNRSEEHTSELQSRRNLVCRLLLEKKK